MWHIVKKVVCLPLLASALLITGCTTLPESRNSSADIKTLITLLTGQFDSSRQMREDIANQVDKKEAHLWVNRVFIKVDAPEMPYPVLVGSTRYGPPWTFDKYEFLVWSFQPDPESSGILMSPKRFKDSENLIPYARIPEKLSGFGVDDLETAKSGAACDIVWTRNEDGFSGRSKPCNVMSTTQNKMLSWMWGFEIQDDALYIEFSGKDEVEGILDGTPEGKPYRLDRVEGSAEYENGHYLLFNPETRADIAEAIKLLELAVIENPEHAPTKIALMYAYLRQSKYAEAQAVAKQINALQSSLSALDELWFEALEGRVADDYPLEIAAWEKLLEQDPKNRWASYELATIYYRSGDYAKTARAIENTLLIEPDESKWGATSIYYLYSKALYRIGKYAAAVKAAEPGVRNTNTRRATYYRKAMAQVASGELTDPSEALATYYEYSKRNGTVNDATHHANVAMFFFELADYDNAVKSARAGYALSKGMYQTFALGYAMIEQGNASQGLEIINKGLTRHPENVYLLAAKGWGHYRLGQMNKAESATLLAQSNSKRKNTAVERDLMIIQNALKNPAAKQVNAVRWFGD